MEHDLSGLWQNKKFKMESATLKYFVKEILEGLKYIHDQCHVIHRDVKSSNILINAKGEVKLADFGLAREYFHQELQTDLVVTLWYRAPEILMYSQHYDYKIDVWSVGCIFGELLKKEALFKDR
eukprot:UN03248